MRVGVLTFHYCFNYGAVLQTESLCSALSSQGHEVHVIDLRHHDSNGWYRDRARLLSGSPPFVSVFAPLVRRKNASFDSYIRRRLPLWSVPPNCDFWLTLAETFDAVVVGSDEVWTAKFGFPSSFLPDSAPESLRLVSYAASVGGEVPDPADPRCGAALRSFASISVRDRATEEFVWRALGAAPTLAVDPVLLVDDISQVVEPAVRPAYVPDRYALLYQDRPLLPAQALALHRFARSYELDVVSVGAMHPSAGFVGHVDCDPGGMVSLVRGAAVVVTSMLHGVLTAMNQDRPVRIIVVPGKQAKLLDAAERFGLQSHLGIGPELGELSESSRAAVAEARRVSWEFLAGLGASPSRGLA